MGDIIPYYEDGVFKLFYLGVGWTNVSTVDQLHFYDEYRTGIYGGTGSVIKVDGIYHMYYCKFTFEPYMRQYVCHAVSEDLKTWKELPEETFQPDDVLYEMTDWRDPHVIWNEEEGCWWMLLAAQRKGLTMRKGCVGLCKSTDLHHWTIEEPLYASSDLSSWELWEPLLLPGTTSCECPDLFKWGDWWYCFYSTDWVTRYMRAPSLEGPWEHPPMEAFDSHAFYAAKTGVLNGKHYLCGWIATRGGYSGEFSDTSAWDRAGNLAVYELEQDLEGWLSIHLLETIREAFGEPVPLNGQLLLAEGRAEGNRVTISADRDGGGVVFEALPDRPVLISTDVSISENARGAGFSFGGANYYRALAVELDMKFGLLRYDSSIVARMRYSVESSHISRKIDTEKRSYHLDVLIDNDVAVFFLDNREALSTRIYRMPGMPWGVYVSDGEACFDNLTMRILEK